MKKSLLTLPTVIALCLHISQASADATAAVNDKTLTITGSVIRNVIIKDGKVSVNGKPLSVNTEEKIFTIIINGNVEGTLRVDTGDVTINGNIAQDASTSQGDIKVAGSVGGNATTSMGSISANEIKGSATTSMGDILCKK